MNLSIFSNDTLVSFANNNVTFERDVWPFWYCMSIVIDVVGGVGYLFLIAAHCCQQNPLSGCGLLLLCLFLTECTLPGIFSPVWSYATEVYSYGRRMNLDCRTFSFAMYLCIYAANWTSFFLAFNRLIATFYPHRYQFWSSKKVVLSMLLCSWSLSTTLALLPFFGIGARYTEVKGLYFCNSIYENRTVAYVMLTIGHFIPIASVFVIYVGLYLKVKTKSRALLERQSTLVKRRFAITKMLFAASCWYIACFVPSTTLATLNFLNSYYVMVWMRNVFYMGFAANPWICFLLNEPYRKQVMRGFRKICSVSAHSRVSAISNVNSTSSHRGKDNTPPDSPIGTH